LDVEKLGKRKVINEENVENVLLSSKNDALGTAVRMLDFDRILLKCQDGKERLCRVRGKLKRSVWIRDEDVVLVSPWDLQSELEETYTSRTGRTRLNNQGSEATL
jgi:translation initiation factor 1A